MSGADRLNVTPSRMELSAIKDRVKAAQQGYSLLKRKSDAIKMKLNGILVEILTAKRLFCPKVIDAAYSHTEAVFAAGDFNPAVLQSVKKATFRVEPEILNIAGVKVPDYRRRIMDTKSDAESLLGLSQGGQEVTKCRDIYIATLEGLVRVASLQAQWKLLDEELKVTNRRVNALEFVIVPKLIRTIDYIKQELEELEREDKNRIAKVKAIREVQDALEKLEREMRNAAAHQKAIEEGKVSEAMVSKEQEQAEAPTALGETRDTNMDVVDAFD